MCKGFIPTRRKARLQNVDHLRESKLFRGTLLAYGSNTNACQQIKSLDSSDVCNISSTEEKDLHPLLESRCIGYSSAAALSRRYQNQNEIKNTNVDT